jgi:hypothetical protein
VSFSSPRRRTPRLVGWIRPRHRRRPRYDRRTIPTWVRTRIPRPCPPWTRWARDHP